MAGLLMFGNFIALREALPSYHVDYRERLRQEMQRYERELIVNALAAAGGNVTAAAQSLKIPVRTLTHKMQALGINALPTAWLLDGKGVLRSLDALDDPADQIRRLIE